MKTVMSFKTVELACVIDLRLLTQISWKYKWTCNMVTIVNMFTDPLSFLSSCLRSIEQTV